MLDQSLESRLRAALEAEGDGLTLTITADELERRLALRRRPAAGRFGSVGLAAAVTLSLVGLAAVAGGWFGPRPVVPAPSASVGPSSIPSLTPSAPPISITDVPPLEDVLVLADPSRVVRAQAVGPSGGPGSEPIQPGTVRWAPVTQAGTYRLWIVCAGDSELAVETGSSFSFRTTVVPCNGEIVSQDHELSAGSGVALRARTSVAWRAVLEAPPREPLRAAGTAPEWDVRPGGWTTLTESASDRSLPSYEPLASDAPERASVASVPNRERYQVWFSCAGPSPLEISFGATVSGLDNQAVIIEYIRTIAECDGATHVDTIDLPLLSGAEITVSYDARVAWRVAVLAETPPIAVPENDATWTMSSASGPNWEVGGQQEGVSLVAGDPGDDVRIVVSCEGDGPLKVTTDTGNVQGERLDPFEVPCEAGKPATIGRVYRNVPGQVSALLDPGGKPMWIVFATQVRR